MGQIFLTLNDGNTKVDINISMLLPETVTNLGYSFENGVKGFLKAMNML